MRFGAALFSLLAVGCTPALVPHMGRALVQLATVLPSVDDELDTERTCEATTDAEDARLWLELRRALRAREQARRLTDPRLRHEDETVMVVAVLARERRSVCD